MNKYKILPIMLLLLFFALFSYSHAAIYYVSSTGAASWSSCTNISTPCSWQTAVQNAKAGDSVYFRGGTYEPGVASSYEIPAMNPTNSGTSGNPIIFIAYPGETPLIHDADGGAAIGAYQRSYITWDGFTLDRDKATGIGASSIITIYLSNYISIKNCNVTGRPHKDHTNGTLISIAQSRYTYIENNKLHGVSEASDKIESVTNAAAIWVFDFDHTYIYNNDIYDNVYGVATKVDHNNLYVYNNHFYNCSRAAVRIHPQTSNNTDFHIYQNLVRSCAGFVEATDAMANPYYNLTIYNNTVYNSTSSTGILIGSQDYNYSRNAVVYNNIFSLGGTSSLFVNYYSGTSFPSYANYNNFHGIGSWKLNYSTIYYSLSDWRAASGADGSSITSNPLFVNPGGTKPEDYMLSSGSPARNAGRYGGDLGAFTKEYGTVIGYRTPQRPLSPKLK